MSYTVPKLHGRFLSGFARPVTGFRVFHLGGEVYPKGSVVNWADWGWSDTVQPNPKVEMSTLTWARMAGVLQEDLPGSVSLTTPTWGVARRGSVQALVSGTINPSDPLKLSTAQPGVLIANVGSRSQVIATAMGTHTGMASLCLVMIGVGQEVA